MELTVLFMPFRVTQSISDPEIIGYSQARTVWQTWLSKRLFSIMEFDGDHGPYRRDIAINLALQKGADIAIGGFVTYCFMRTARMRTARWPYKWKFMTQLPGS
jgi:hypothetical protein